MADVPDLSGRVALVTGANRGLGYAVAVILAQKGAKVYIACRSLDKAVQAVQQMEIAHEALKGRLIPLEVDLGSVRKSKAAGEEVIRLEGIMGRLDILICNAAQTGTPYEENEEGISTIMASNHLGHCALTLALLPLLDRTDLSPPCDVRVILVTSAGYALAPKPWQFKSVRDFRNDAGQKEGGLVTQLARYGQTKLANILFAAELQRRFKRHHTQSLALSVHPGGVVTSGAKNFLRTWYWVFAWGFVPPEKAAKAIVFDAASPKVREQGWGGAYLVPGGKKGKLQKGAQDETLAKDLWELSERVCKEIEEKGKVE
ncbi:NADP-binding protein [Dacryopinax primogenitus]|uniref:NADP-binding protein n=1 Tax=Dacryopinax primogenitus (strain DJM 731) TaxID=1858805 RepID=M5FX38_DACPD|nr:NADP-binding protein [Dacryopinax primogenitus]EJT98036.1 NADP-binding protein [Dacryopinax primogenitus]